MLFKRWRRAKWDPDYPMRRRSRRAISRGLLLLVLATLFLGAPAAFVRTQCYSLDGPTHAMPSSAVSAAGQIRGYNRDEARSYLAFPEWFIVYAAEEHAAFIERDRPSHYPYFRSIAQYWSSYRDVCA